LFTGKVTNLISPELYELQGISVQTLSSLARDLKYLSFEVTPPSIPEYLREFPGEEGGTPSSPAISEEEMEKDT
jgi:hypothetical protein